MAIRVTCPFCKTTNQLGDDKRGRKVACRGCKKVLNIPAAKKRDEEGSFSDQSKIKAKASIASARNREEDEDEGDSPKSKKKENKKSFPILLVAGGVAGLFFVLLLLGAGIAGYYYLREKPTQATPVAEAKKEETTTIQSEPKETKKVPEKKGTLTEKKVPPEEKKETVSEKKVSPPEKKDPPMNPPANGMDSETLDRVKQATVYIKATLPNNQIVEGSGFLALEPGVVVTNSSILGMQNNSSMAPLKIEVVLNYGLSSETRATGQVLGVDRDLALLRIAGANLPAPLPLDASGKLYEKLTVYYAGLPAGNDQGKAIAVSDTTISGFLRHPVTQGLQGVQINDNLNPGHLGGPLLTVNGNVIGVSVAPAKGAPLKLANAADLVNQLAAGRLDSFTLGTPATQNNQTTLPIRYSTLDPLNRIKQLRVEVWTAPTGTPPLPASMQAPMPRPGESPRQSYTLKSQSGELKDTLSLPAILPGQVCWLQPVFVNAEGTTWGPAIPVPPTTPSSPYDLKPANLTTNFISPNQRTVKLKYTFTNTATVGDKSVTTIDQAELDFLEALSSMLDPTGTKLTKMRTALGTLVFTQEKNGQKKTIAPAVLDPLRPAAPVFFLDEINKKMKIVNDPQWQQVVDSSIFGLLWMPNRVVQPGETFQQKTTIQVKTLRPSLEEVRIPIEVTLDCVYQGMQTRNGRNEAVITVSGTLKAPGDASFSGGKVSGKLGFDVDGGFISHVELNLNSDYDIQDPTLGLVKRNLLWDIQLDRIAGNANNLQLAQEIKLPGPGPNPNPKVTVVPPGKAKEWTFNSSLTATDGPDLAWTKGAKVAGLTSHMKVLGPVNMQAGKNYNITVNAQGFTPHVRLLNSTTGMSVENKTAPAMVQFTYRCTAPGVFAVAVSTHNAKVGTFSLTVTESP